MNLGTHMPDGERSKPIDREVYHKLNLLGTNFCVRNKQVIL
jgi:hypothetical protein